MATLQAFKSTLGYSPKQGSFALPVKLPFLTNAITTFNIDFFKEQSEGQVEFFQSIFIDNSLNAQPLAIKFSGFQQTISVRTQMQGFFPIFVPNAVLSLTAVTQGNVDINIILSNVFINPSVWQSA